MHQNFVCDIGRSVVGKSQCQIVSSRFPPIGLEIDSSAYYDPCGGRVFDDGFCVGVHISMKNIGKSHLVLIWESKGERRRFYLNIPFFQEIYDIRKTERGLIIGVNTHNGMSQEFHLDRFVRMSRLSASETAVVALSYHNQYTPDENEPFYPHCGILYLMEEVISEWLSSHFDSLSAEEVWFVIGAYAKSNQFHDDFMVRFNQTAENS